MMLHVTYFHFYEFPTQSDYNIFYKFYKKLLEFIMQMQSFSQPVLVRDYSMFLLGVVTSLSLLLHLSLHHHWNNTRMLLYCINAKSSSIKATGAMSSRLKKIHGIRCCVKFPRASIWDMHLNTHFSYIFMPL
jgi:hypothetical protein